MAKPTKEELPQGFLTFRATPQVPLKRIGVILISAFGGCGSGYWAVIKRDPTKTAPWETDPKKPGGELVLTCNEGEVNGKTEWTLNLETIKTGLQVYVDSYPEEIPNLLNEDYWNGDGPEADRFLQCCCFGEVIFG